MASEKEARSIILQHIEVHYINELINQMLSSRYDSNQSHDTNQSIYHCVVQSEKTENSQKHPSSIVCIVQNSTRSVYSCIRATPPVRENTHA